MSQKDRNNTQKLIEYDLAFKSLVAGCDEAGRGPLAGPVVCAACVMPLDEIIEGIDDSKKLSESKRETLYERIIKKAISYRVSVINHDIIDQINILNATKKGMAEAINKLKSDSRQTPELVLIDAVKPDVIFKTQSIINGDALSYNIAAASIIAKVTRDRLMRQYDKIYPEYNFKENKGYGTAQHVTALKEFGATEIHRRTFIKNFFQNKN